MARETEQLGAGVVGSAERCEPGCAAAQDIGHDGDGLDIVDGGWRAVEADIGREWRLEPRQALLDFETFEQGCLFAANLSSRPMAKIGIEIPAIEIVLAD